MSTVAIPLTGIYQQLRESMPKHKRDSITHFLVDDIQEYLSDMKLQTELENDKEFTDLNRSIEEKLGNMS